MIVQRQGRETRSQPGPAPTVAEVLRPLLDVVAGHQLPVRLEFWDGSGIGPPAQSGVVALRSANALRRIMWAPDELGIGAGVRGRRGRPRR